MNSTTKPVPTSWLTYGGMAGLYIASVKSRINATSTPHRTICLMAKVPVQNAHIGMNAHNQQMGDPLVLQVTIHLCPLIRNNIPLLVDPNPRMLPIPSLIGLSLARIRPVI